MRVPPVLSFIKESESVVSVLICTINMNTVLGGGKIVYSEPAD